MSPVRIFVEKTMKRYFFPSTYLTLSLLCMLGSSCAAQNTATDSLIPNGNFETDADNDSWPDKWGKLKVGGSYENEAGNHFLRLASTEPDKMVLLYTPVNIPAGTKALELSWKQRISNLKVGNQAWFDARIMLDYKDAAGNKMKGAPGAPYARKDTDGWVEKKIQFIVPEGVKMLEFMPTLFNVKSGTFDLDDISLKPTDSTQLEAAAKESAAAQANKETANAANKQAKAAANIGADGSMIPNVGFQADENGDGTPDKWGAGKGNQSWEMEGDNRYLRLTSTEPGKLVLLYRDIDIPAGIKALQLSWKQRVSNLKVGKQAWFDARILMEFKDAAGNKMKGNPAASATRKNTEGWVEKTQSFLVPEGAVTIAFMPTLFQVESGIFDLDDISLKATDEGELKVAAAKAAEVAEYVNVKPETPNLAKWPAELHVEGTKILTKDGKEISLRGLNIDSLQWNPRGERVLRNAIVGVEDWKANLLRLPIKEDYWFGREAGQTDGGVAYRKLVDDFITITANRGAYTMIDLHRFRAPKREHIEFWKDVATKYKNNQAVIFEVFNEPHGISWDVWQKGGFVADKDAPADEDAFLTPEEKAQNTKGFHSVGIQALIDAIRGTGAKNIVVAGGLDWAYDLSGMAKGYTLDQKGGNGMLLSTHIYAGKRDWQNKVLVMADKYPIIVSEFGANTQKFTFMPAESQEDAATWVPKIFGFIDKYKLNYTAFSFHPKSGPHLLQDWDYTPTPEWGAFAKRSLAGEKFPDKGMR